MNAFVASLPLQHSYCNNSIQAGTTTTRQRELTAPANNHHGVVVMQLSRRELLRQFIAVPVAAAILRQPNSALAAMYSTDTVPTFKTTGDPNKISTYLPQIEEGYKTLTSLRDNWEQKTAAYDGDVVRRDLGTVGVKSPLFNIRKAFFKAWQLVAESSQDDEMIERLEGEWNDVLNGISSVDFQLYSVGFTELTETKDSLVKQGRVALDDLISVYSDMLTDFRAAAS